VLGKRRLLLAMSVVLALGSRWAAGLFLLAFVGGECRKPFAYRIRSLSPSESRCILLGHLLLGTYRQLVLELMHESVGYLHSL
jgi:hypothetical protein